MKDLVKIIGIFAFFVLIIPLPALFAADIRQSAGYDGYPPAEAEEAPPEALPDTGIFRILDISSGQVTEMTMYDYIRGAVMAEMPASYSEEALKAQAVAARTYAVRRIYQQLEDPDPSLMGAHISNDSSRYQAYFTDEQAKSFYGDSYDEYSRKVAGAASETAGEILTYNGEPIIAAFHAVSSGRTESAETVWGNRLDYLVPADSAQDKSSPMYLDERRFSFDELAARLYAAYDIALSGNEDEPFLVTAVSPSGTVTEVSAGGKALTGAEVRSVLSLRSACFEVKYDKEGGIFTFITKGSGHGVGMSQYGAEMMAREGSTYRDILLHYYTGAELTFLSQ